MTRTAIVLLLLALGACNRSNKGQDFAACQLEATKAYPIPGRDRANFGYLCMKGKGYIFNCFLGEAYQIMEDCYRNP
jgi:hypothetical protein